MRNKVLLLANFKRHKATMIGIFVIMMIVSLSLVTVISIWLNSNTYLRSELKRINFGDITVWTQGDYHQEQLRTDIEELEDVEQVFVQSLIYADYNIKDTSSDSEGQLIAYEPQRFPYRIFNETQNGYQEDIVIAPGEILISASLLSTYAITLGDEIAFPIDRQGNEKIFKIIGTFEDPFMGSSMIGMKSFLISQNDFDELQVVIEQASINALARSGQMQHVLQHKQSTLSLAQFNRVLNEQTTLANHVEFVHSSEAMMNFMLVLQNAFTGLFLAFSLLLFIISMIIVSYSIGATIDQDQLNISILKTIGYDGKKLRGILKLQYLSIILVATIIGMLVSLQSVPWITQVMVSFAGILTPAIPQFQVWVLILFSITVLFTIFIHLKTRRIMSIPPVNIMQAEVMNNHVGYFTNHISLQKHNLIFWISMRQLMSGKKRYISVCVTTILLVFFTSTIMRMNAWLGPDGKGMMDAFNPADLDVGVQLIGNNDVEEMKSTIQQFSAISDSYELAMPSVALDGVDYTANVISDASRFHILQGTTSTNVDEIVITETIAADNNLVINDRVSLSYNGKSAIYIVSGIYQCANDMGGNIGMSYEGFLQIGEITKDMRCHHYFLENPQQKQSMINALQTMYGGDVYIHENTWPGLNSIIAAMKALLMSMYGATALFILIVTMLTGNKLFLSEKRNLSIYKSLGFTTRQLRFTFAIRYGIIAIIGSVLGTICSAIGSDIVIAFLMKLYGISNFASNPDSITILFPALVISVLFSVCAYITSAKIKKLDMNELVVE